MIDKLPPLNSLKAFDAAGRHLNFSHAAAELMVSVGAVSQQIGLLEDWIGKPLFNRTNRGLQFTELGKQYHHTITNAFNEIRSATGNLSRPETSKKLTISSTTSFTMKFLLPRISSFRELWPDVDISIQASTETWHFNQDEGDVAIRYGANPSKDFWSKKISQDAFILTASPDIAAKSIDHSPFLIDSHFDNVLNFPDWKQLRDTFQLNDKFPIQIRQFSQHWMVIEAAINGEGVALVKKILVKDDLKSGKLKQIGVQEIGMNTGYFLLTAKGNESDKVFRSFEKWINSMT